jgi:phosphoglucosamine mutase
MSIEPLFGTDGIRGPFGKPPLDQETLRRLGMVLGRLLDQRAVSRPVLLAGDTRASTPDICRWLIEGLAATGAQWLYGGVLPTPAISRLVPQMQLPLGIAVSASHNPSPDNGVKLLDVDGAKWESGPEDLVAERLRETESATDSAPQELTLDHSLRDAYLSLLTERLSTTTSLAGLRLTLDCANGAASGLAEILFTGLGAEVETLGDTPDGHNINAGCGSTAPQAMAATTAASGSQIGFAFDGDADRVIVADESGVVRDGDAILFLLAKQLHEKGSLSPARIVATTMSNLGLEVALEREDIGIVRCDVGDRIVVQTLRREGLTLGGEQSGHIVHLGHGPTGDGLQTALLLAQILAEAERPLSELLQDLRTFPQILRNVEVASKPDLLSLPSVQAAAREVAANLGDQGRLVLRYSGTEPLARIMIEGPEQEMVESLASHLAAAIRSEIGAAG